MKVTLLYTLLILSLGSSLVLAEEQPPRIDELSWLETNQLERQVEQIDEIARLQLGTPVRGNLDDLELLQRIIYRGLVKQKDKEGLQALGAVLGNVMVSELDLEWKTYEDELGKSRAACIPETRECLFPITMLSRRMEVGLLPDVNRIFNDVADMVASYRQKQKHLAPVNQGF